MTKKQKYLNSEAHGYLLESDACALLIKELERVCTKFQRRIDKENAARQADFDAAMEYHSENEIQDAYGWELITEAQYHAYMDLFHRGRQALEEHAPTVSELALSIARRVIYDLESDQREFAFSALTPEQPFWFIQSKCQKPGRLFSCNLLGTFMEGQFYDHIP